MCCFFLSHRHFNCYIGGGSIQTNYFIALIYLKDVKINNIIIDANLTSISALLTKWKVKMAGYWPISFLPF